MSTRFEKGGWWDKQALAGGQLPQGDRVCAKCGRPLATACIKRQRRRYCLSCGSTPVEPEGAQPPSTSVLSPPVPCSDANWAALRGPELDKLVDAVDHYDAAKSRHRATRSEYWRLARNDRATDIFRAALCFVDELRTRAEGGDNK